MSPAASSNVNGAIRLESAHVGGGIETVNGDIDVGSGSHVDGGIHVREAGRCQLSPNVPTIVIGPGATVNGGDDVRAPSEAVCERHARDQRADRRRDG